MRDDDFKKLLTEVANWEMPLTLEKPPRSRERQDYIEQNNLDCYNPTYPPRLLKIKNQIKECEDCGKVCDQRRKELSLYRSNGSQIFKEKCLACGLHKDPFTGKFTLDGLAAQRKYISYFRSTHYIKKQK